jgi:hypothetical protein
MCGRDACGITARHLRMLQCVDDNTQRFVNAWAVVPAHPPYRIATRSHIPCTVESRSFCKDPLFSLAPAETWAFPAAVKRHSWAFCSRRLSEGCLSTCRNLGFSRRRKTALVGILRPTFIRRLSFHLQKHAGEKLAFGGRLLRAGGSSQKADCSGQDLSPVTGSADS